MVKVGVVGLGAIGRQHLRVYEASPEAEIVAVADPNLELVTAEAQRLGATAYASLADLLRDSDVEAISLATPDQLHFEDALRVIDAGKHLLIEKPLATIVAEADELAHRAMAADSVVMVGHTPRFDPRYNAARAVLERGGIGEIVHGYARRNNKNAVAARVGGRTSVTFFLGVHDLFVLLWLTGLKVVEVQAMETGHRSADGHQAVAVVANLRMENGAVVQLEAGWGLPNDFPTEIDARLRLVGSTGELAVDIFDQGIRVFESSYALPIPTGTPLHGAPQGTIRDEILAFLSAITTGASLPVTTIDAANAVRVAEAIDRAARSGKPVTIGYPSGF